MTNTAVEESLFNIPHPESSRMRRSSAGFLLAVVLLGCAADGITADVSAYAGDYTLRSINGNTLPYAVQNTPTRTLAITSETFTLLATGSFVDITHYQDTQNSVVTYPADTLRGTFTVRGQTADFTTSKGDLFSGTMGAAQFTIEGSATVSLYSK
jgi:hypothetical protein